MASNDSIRDYHRYLVAFMKFRDNINYTSSTQFSNAQLLSIQPEEIVNWLRIKAYGDPPAELPIEGRSTSLEYCKKAISYFMPDRLSDWSVATNRGNPTKSIPVNDFIRKVKKHESRREGKPSQARRPLEANEYALTIQLLEREASVKKALLVATAVKFQYCLVARVDDTAHFMKDELKVHPIFPFALQVRLLWSKNVMEERDAPHQIILGSMEARFCVLLALAVYMEVCFAGDIAIATDNLFCTSDCVKSTIDFIYETLTNVWNGGNFVPSKPGPIGTHSIRKHAFTRARRSGCSKDEADYRGRWRKRRVSDRYADMDLPYPDAKVAAKLCHGGPVKYKLKTNSGINSAWLREHVVPNIVRCNKIDSSVADVLALPLLWGCLDETVGATIPVALCTRVQVAYRQLTNALAIGENPVKKIPLLVTGHEDELRINELEGLADSHTLISGIDHSTEGFGYDQFSLLYSEFTSGYRELKAEIQLAKEELRGDLRRLSHAFNTGQQRLVENVQRIALQPVLRPAVNRNVMTADRALGQHHPPATLSENPKTLYILWQEYQFGIGGRKAAKDFNAEERGAHKATYSKRKIIWDKIAGLVRASYTSDMAIEKIYQAYGIRTPVSKIIQKMREDNRTIGGHPDLNV